MHFSAIHFIIYASRDEKAMEVEVKVNTVINNYPMIIIENKVVFPSVVSHIDISDKVSISALKKAMAGEKKIFLIPKYISEDNSSRLSEYGTVASIIQLIKIDEDNYRVVVEGKDRGKIYLENEDESINPLDIKVQVKKEEWYDEINNNIGYVGKINVIREQFAILANGNPRISKEAVKKILEADNLFKKIWFIVNVLSLSIESKLQVLNIEDDFQLLEDVSMLMNREIDCTVISNEFKRKVKNRVDKNQKEYVLREQLKLLKQELGEDSGENFNEELKDKIDKIKAEEDVKNKLIKEYKRLNRMSPQSSEANVIQNYLETLLDIPWIEKSKDNDNLKAAKNILEKEHYGLDKVKERIVEFLAVRLYTNGMTKSPIICLVGPPGTGKTSIAMSVAKAMNKEYSRICLGGICDEAEIRGHRRTYIGAKPGRIIDTLIKAKVNNPVILFDEIDKIGSDYKGDPSSALLEVLDPAQNSSFIDRYVEMPVDLSGVFFMATANDVSKISGPLRDRMEIIDISSYTSNEKYHIAKEYLIKKQRKNNGLKASQLTFSKEAIDLIISMYTREAGVRELERLIDKICRKIVCDILCEDVKNVKITAKNVEKYLGNPKYKEEKKNTTPMVGITRGLAWTSVGGDTLEIEAVITSGTGKLKLTGKLGDVMKESADIAMSYVRTLLTEKDIKKEYDKDFFAENDIHIHVPEGAVPKDGPSAGVTMATTLYSAITDKPVSSQVAMTGEITLRGNVLPIGGLKEKILAAKKFGIKKVIVPRDNERDVLEISKEITDGLDIVFVSEMTEVLKNAIIE